MSNYKCSKCNKSGHNAATHNKSRNTCSKCKQPGHNAATHDRQPSSGSYFHKMSFANLPSNSNRLLPPDASEKHEKNFALTPHFRTKLSPEREVGELISNPMMRLPSDLAKRFSKVKIGKPNEKDSKIVREVLTITNGKPTREERSLNEKFWKELYF